MTNPRLMSDIQFRELVRVPAEAPVRPRRPAVNDTAFIVRAAAFAAERHRDQRRKDAEASPHINHPLALADVLANEGNIICLSVSGAGFALTSNTRDDLLGGHKLARERVFERFRDACR